MAKVSRDSKTPMLVFFIVPLSLDVKEVVVEVIINNHSMKTARATLNLSTRRCSFSTSKKQANKPTVQAQANLSLSSSQWANM